MVYGDLGNVNARSLGRMQKLAQNGDFDMVLHVGNFNLLWIKFITFIYSGDYAYDLNTVLILIAILPHSCHVLSDKNGDCYMYFLIC